MKTSDFICSCIGVDSDVIDEICDEFGVDLEDSDVLSAIRFSSEENSWGAGQEILQILFGKIIDNYKHLLDRDKFDYDFSSPSFPSFYYNEKEFHTKEELDEIIENETKEQD